MNIQELSSDKKGQDFQNSSDRPNTLQCKAVQP